MKAFFSRFALFGLAALSFPGQAEEWVLKVAHFLPPTATMHNQVIEPWCEKIRSESQGRLQCQLFPAMQLGGSPAQLLNQVRDGVADVVWTLPGYTPGRFPLTEVFELPFITTTASASSRALWTFAQTRAEREFTGLKPLAIWVSSPYLLHLRNQPVHQLEDLAGLKIRAPSRLGNKLLSALGATPVGMPVPQMAESLSRGVIDGALVPWEVVPATRTHELTRFHVETRAGRALMTSTMIYVMNEKKYRRLPAELQQIIDANSGQEFSAWIAQRHQNMDETGRELARDRGNQVEVLSSAEMERWEAAAKPVTEEWIREANTRKLDGNALVEEAQSLIRSFTTP